MIIIKQDGIIHSVILSPGDNIDSAVVRDYDSSEYDTEKGIDSLRVDQEGKVYRKSDCVILPMEKCYTGMSMKAYMYRRIENLLGREDKNICLEGNVAEIPLTTLFAILAESNRRENACKENV